MILALLSHLPIAYWSEHCTDITKYPQSEDSQHGPTVDDFQSTVPCLNFEICTIPTQDTGLVFMEVERPYRAGGLP